MKVLFLIAQLSGGGAERQCALVARTLREKNLDVHLLYLRPGPDKEVINNNANYLHCININNNYDPRIMATILKFFKILKPDIIMSWSAPQMDIISGLITAFNNKLRWIIAERNSATLYQKGFKNRIRRYLAEHSAAVIANSQEGADYWRKSGYLGRIEVLANILAIDDILQAKTNPTSVKVPTDEQPFILYAGRITAQKNVENLIDAFALIDHPAQPLLVLCGEGELHTSVTERIKRHRIAHRVIMTGFLTVQDVWFLMSRAHSFVLPSFYEGRANVLMEAALCGCPIVASDIPQNREALNGYPAIYVDPHDPLSIAAGLVHSLDRGDWVDMQQHCRASNKAITEGYLRLFKEIVNRRAVILDG